MDNFTSPQVAQPLSDSRSVSESPHSPRDVVPDGEFNRNLVQPVQPFLPTADPREEPLQHQREAKQAEVALRFNQALAMLHAERFEEAKVALHRVIELDPRRPEAYVNMGFALLRTGDPSMALDFFLDAIDLNPGQANAYFGAAIAYEGLGDLQAAMSGMRSFLHLVDEPDPNQIHVAQARSALWEWEAKLGKGPWGPTQGVPPGLEPSQIRRDGLGTATMMPKWDTQQSDGSMEFEIRHSDRTPGLFKP